jgi:hypothetical protein
MLPPRHKQERYFLRRRGAPRVETGFGQAPVIGFSSRLQSEKPAFHAGLCSGGGHLDLHLLFHRSAGMPVDREGRGSIGREANGLGLYSGIHVEAL